MNERVKVAITAFILLTGIVTTCNQLIFQLQSILRACYCSMWFYLTEACYFLGLIALVLEQTEDPQMGNSQILLEYHYWLAFLAIVIGYPMLVTYTWILGYSAILAQLHLLLPITPLVGWFNRSEWTVRSTQICGGIAAVSHWSICMMAKDVWGVSSAFAMVGNILALSVPTKYQIGVFTARELLIVGLIVVSAFLNNSIEAMQNRNR